MANISQSNESRGLSAEASAFSVSPISASDRSAVRTDTALLVSILFLQRFSLPFGNKSLALDLVALALILSYQFLSGNLLIQYDRLIWFLLLALAFTCSLLLNFNSTMLTAYSETMVLCSLFMLKKSPIFGLYKNTLLTFQSFVLLLACLGVAQFAAQFVVDSTKLMNLYGIFPDPPFHIFVEDALYRGSIFRSNAIFLSEASTLSQITGLGILIEILEFRRPRYLLVMTLGFLVSHSGTGSILLLIFLPLAGISQGKAGLSVLLVVVFTLGLFVTGIFDSSALLDRTGEFKISGSSGYSRFVSPFTLAAREFNTKSLIALLVGSGPGSVSSFTSVWQNSLDTGGFAATWLKILYEYGIIGSFILACFLASCLRRSRCPRLIVAATIFAWIFLQGAPANIIILCTLSGPELRGHVRETN